MTTRPVTLIGLGTRERTTTTTTTTTAAVVVDDDPRLEPKIPFDRVFALTSLGAQGVALVVWATVTPVQIAGAIIAALAFPFAARITYRELKTPRHERGADIKALRRHHHTQHINPTANNHG